MRAAWSVLGLLLSVIVAAQVRINELQCTRTPGTDGTGTNGDWVELINTGRSPVDLQGHVLSVGGRTASIGPGLRIRPGERAVLWCGTGSAVKDRLPLKLPRAGGSLLLFAPDGATLLDLFTWPALPPGVSIGRTTDGAKTWGYFAAPSPGAPNHHAVSGLLVPPKWQYTPTGMELIGPPGGEVRLTLDGTLPGPESPCFDPLKPFASGTVVQARALATGAVPSVSALFTFGLPDQVWSLAIDPQDLHGPDGIADTTSGNHARKGRAWQRQAWLQRGERVDPVGLAVAGSGSRSLPKRNWQLLVRDRFQGGQAIALPDGSAWRTLMLRADATPNAFLRNTFMHEVARRSGGRVDLQPWFPAPLYLNGYDQGLYRVMPSKGEAWLRSLNGDAPVEVLKEDGLVQGSHEPFKQLLHVLKVGSAMTDLERELDVESLIELACFDLWTGRADHDINLRAWRPARSGGRWRWVLYDMDLWAPPKDPSVRRMCWASQPQAPFLPQILGSTILQELFLARFSALCATTLRPDRAVTLADSLFNSHRAALVADHARWRSAMAVPEPQAGHATLLDHIAQRNGELFRQLATHTGRTKVAITVQVEPPGAGVVLVEGLFLTSVRQGMDAFQDVPLHMEARAAEGMEFVQWTGSAGNVPRTVIHPVGNLRVTAVFRAQGLSRQGGL